MNIIETLERVEAAQQALRHDMTRAFGRVDASLTRLTNGLLAMNERLGRVKGENFGNLDDAELTGRQALLGLVLLLGERILVLEERMKSLEKKPRS